MPLSLSAGSEQESPAGRYESALFQSSSITVLQEKCSRAPGGTLDPGIRAPTFLFPSQTPFFCNFLYLGNFRQWEPQASGWCLPPILDIIKRPRRKMCPLLFSFYRLMPTCIRTALSPLYTNHIHFFSLSSIPTLGLKNDLWKNQKNLNICNQTAAIEEE